MPWLRQGESVTVPQVEIFVIVAVMLVLFMWDRLRHDLVACLALVATIVTGTVAPGKTFSGFSNPVIILIAATLVLGRAMLAWMRLSPTTGAPSGDDGGDGHHDREHGRAGDHRHDH